MTNAHQGSDALVFFGATGDLAYKKIFPALYGMTKKGHLGAPVIGVASSSWTVDDLRKRAQDSINEHGGGIDDKGAFEKLSQSMSYVDGDSRPGPRTTSPYPPPSSRRSSRDWASRARPRTPG
jgi:glucose-6-phosphate 1-dehydrogenase